MPTTTQAPLATFVQPAPSQTDEHSFAMIAMQIQNQPKGALLRAACAMKDSPETGIQHAQNAPPQESVHVKKTTLETHGTPAAARHALTAPLQCLEALILLHVRAMLAFTRRKASMMPCIE